MDRTRRLWRYVAMWRPFALVLTLLAAPLSAQQEMTEVDVELVLAVDVSRSMSPYELEIQRRGYAAALSSQEVMDAIGGGMIGRIALTYVEWAGGSSQTVVVPWTLIDSREAADEVAATLTTVFSSGMRRTSISEALIHAADSFEINTYTGLRRVIDISGDGPNNQGRPVLTARDEVTGRGIIINGLPLMTHDELSSDWGIPDLDTYYTECVIGGPGAFMIPVQTWDQFAHAVRRKLVLEIAGAQGTETERVIPAAGYDCMVGEKIWQRNQGIFSEP